MILLGVGLRFHLRFATPLSTAMAAQGLEKQMPGRMITDMPYLDEVSLPLMMIGCVYRGFQAFAHVTRSRFSSFLGLDRIAEGAILMYRRTAGLLSTHEFSAVRQT
jgi:hypothetical protein